MSSPAPGDTSISFSEQDLAVFSKASGDCNPLHLSAEYARRTAYGQPVVFGCLGAIACLGRIPLSAEWAVTWLQADFFRPMFLGVSYRIETSKRGEHWVTRLFDGTLPVVSVMVKTEPSQGERVWEMPSAATFERCEAAVREPGSIVSGLEISGQYACDPDGLAALMERWSLIDPFLAAMLAWSSYLVGMELPGESALFSKLVLDLDPTAARPAEMMYQASVGSVDARFSQIRMDVSLSGGASTIASGRCWSFVRLTMPDLEEIDTTAVKSDSLAGRTAVLIGASRGLGAAIKRALELRGAAVYSLSRSVISKEAPRTEVGDAADTEALQRLRGRIMEEQGHLDFLICNACPPVLPLRLELNAAERIGAYINSAISMTLKPLCAFLDMLNTSDGCAVIISSTAVEQPVREWPHYVAAKQAVEMLARVAGLQYPRIRTLIVRPQKLLTTLTNTPMGRSGAASAGLFADRIATRLEDSLTQGKTEILS